MTRSTTSHDLEHSETNIDYTYFKNKYLIYLFGDSLCDLQNTIE